MEQNIKGNIITFKNPVTPVPEIIKKNILHINKGDVIFPEDEKKIIKILPHKIYGDTVVLNEDVMLCQTRGVSKSSICQHIVGKIDVIEDTVKENINKLCLHKRIPRSVCAKNSDIGTQIVDSVDMTKICVWQVKINAAQKINLSMSLAMNKDELAAFKNTVTFIASNKLTSYTFPVSGDRVYYLNKTFNSKEDTFQVTQGIMYIKVIYNKTPSIKYNLKINKALPTPPTPAVIPSKTGKKYALLIGISDYLYINDLSFCDEDIVTWADYLKKLNYELTILGDKTSTYGGYKLDNYATEANVKMYMKTIASKIIPGDQFVFISSGHGSGDGVGNSFLCCLDEHGAPEGEYTDKEMAEDIRIFVNNGATVIACFDNCFSGGMLSEICACDTNRVCATSTCTENGYGFDENDVQHGAWTYSFLVRTLCDSNLRLTNITDAFYKAFAIYPYRDGNAPQLLGNGKLMF